MATSRIVKVQPKTTAFSICLIIYEFLCGAVRVTKNAIYLNSKIGSNNYWHHHFCQYPILETSGNMKIRNTLILEIALSGATAAFAQDSDHKIEITGDYSYIHANPQNINIIPTFSLNGGGGSTAFTSASTLESKRNLKGMVAAPTTLLLPVGSFPCQGICSHITSAGSPSSGHRISNHLWRPCSAGRTAILYGNIYNTCPGCTVLSKCSSNNAFDFIIGGRVDLPLGEHFVLRPAQFDYLLTGFGNDFTQGNNTQSNFSRRTFRTAFNVLESRSTGSVPGQGVVISAAPFANRVDSRIGGKAARGQEKALTALRGNSCDQGKKTVPRGRRLLGSRPQPQFPAPCSHLEPEPGPEKVANNEASSLNALEKRE